MTDLRGIDLHTHIVPHTLPAYTGRHNEPLWPCVHSGECGHKHIVIDGRNFRTVSSSAWDTAQRLADMGEMGIRWQVLSPMPELLSHWFSAEDTQSFGRYVNGYIAEMIAREPERFFGLGMVPLQDPDLAARELEHLRALGLHGVEIATNINGKAIGEACFDPFFAAAEAMDMPIFVHALRPVGMERLIGPKILEQTVAFPGETGLAIASLITGGMLERHPRLRIAFSHGGGTFASILPRLQYIWKITPELSQAVRLSPADQARKLFYDTLVYDPATLRHLLDLFGVTQLMIGTDYPFVIHDKVPRKSIDELGLSAEDSERLYYRNAAHFLGLGSP